MIFEKTKFPDVIIIEPKIFEDDRGYFYETYRQSLFEKAGIKAKFIQDNHSFSKRGVLRGLHFQNPNPQGKLVRVVQGEVWDVIVDLRKGSPSFGQWQGFTLSAQNKRQVYVPEGFAHGFLTLSDTAEFVYKCTDEYHPETEATLLWNDPTLKIEWPISTPIVSAKDQKGLSIKDYDAYPRSFKFAPK